MTTEILVERDGPVMTITLNRPEKYNALTFAMYQRLADLCDGEARDGTIRAIVVTGAGGKAFAAGTDIAQFRDFKTPEDGLGYEARVDKILSSIERCPVPMIAAISGACTGGGAAISACCDMRIATRDMRYGFPIARTLGNCLSATSLQRLTGLMGAPRVVDLLFTSRLMTADEALAAGLVTEVVEDHAALMTRAKALADQIAGYAPLTISTTKELMRRIREAAPKVDDHDLVAKVYTSADFREGLDAFLTKRKPQWTGK
ncbi:MAG: enoyl-CoA hydratase/isomerase family protein [Hyphomicrobiaceae bacterium]|nr:enoyl-CoA hydratase/isomerase family protein [Hyphomicrobiaceae bacterium]